MKKSNQTLLIGGVITAVVAVVCIVMAVRASAQAALLQKKLKKLHGDLVAASTKDPYPSGANVTIQNQNVEAIEAKAAELMKGLSKAVIPVQAGTASSFVDRLEKARRELVKTAGAAGTLVPERFAFGFERWSDGAALPDAAILVPLNRQLSAVVRTCEILFDAGALEISKIVREEIEVPVAPIPEDEGDGVVETGPGDGATSGDDQPFKRVRFTVDCVLREKELVTLLNRLAADPMFLVVGSLTLSKDRPDIRMPAPPSRDGRGESGADPNEKIMVAGPGVQSGLRLSLVIDAFHVEGEDADPADAGGSGAAEAATDGGAE